MSETTTPTAKDIWTRLNAATGTAAVIGAAKRYLPNQTSVEIVRQDDQQAWRIRTMCCGTPYTGTRTITAARSDLATLIRDAMDHTVTHGWTATAVANAAKTGRCEDCGKTLSAFDRDASPVAHLCFNCA